MKSNNALWAQTICENLHLNGLSQIVLSPGSRNTPLVLAFEKIPNVEIIVVVDERSAAFFALGLSRVSGSPVALLCTSGTAMAHYLPALIEAHHCHLPLVVLSADRPPELHYSNAPQTMEQNKIFAPWMKKSFCLGTPTEKVSPKWLAAVSAQAMHAAQTEKKGPVHLNIPYRKPLWETPAQTQSVHTVKYHAPKNISTTLDLSWVGELANCSQVLLLCGPQIGCLDGDARRKAILNLAVKMNWPIVADPLSGLRYLSDLSPNVITTYDCFLRAPDDLLQPQRIIQLGRVPTSKVLNLWLQSLAFCERFVVDATGSWNDPHHSATSMVVADPTTFCQHLIAHLSPSDDNFLQHWIAREESTTKYLRDAEETVLWEGKIAQTILENLPSGSLLHVASGMPIRDVDGFGYKQSRAITLCSNRGVNGIDGLIATATGQAFTWTAGPCYALIGDIAFFHDVGSLHTAIQQEVQLTIIVIDNGGGGIFENLPIANHPSAFEKYFLTPQTGDICKIAAGFGIQVQKIDSIQQLKDALQSPPPQGPAMLYLQVDRPTNIQKHRQTYQQQPSSAVKK